MRERSASLVYIYMYRRAHTTSQGSFLCPGFFWCIFHSRRLSVCPALKRRTPNFAFRLSFSRGSATSRDARKRSLPRAPATNATKLFNLDVQRLYHHRQSRRSSSYFSMKNTKRPPWNRSLVNERASRPEWKKKKRKRKEKRGKKEKRLTLKTWQQPGGNGRKSRGQARGSNNEINIRVSSR